MYPQSGDTLSMMMQYGGILMHLQTDINESEKLSSKIFFQNMYNKLVTYLCFIALQSLCFEE